MSSKLLLAILAASLMTAGCVVAPAGPPPRVAVGVAVGPTYGPPARRYERIPPRPGAGLYWRRGDWVWRGSSYVWVGGAWVAPPRSGAVWVDGRWRRDHNRWVWTDGRWR